MRYIIIVVRNESKFCCSLYDLLLSGNSEVCLELLKAGANTEAADVEGLTRTMNYSTFCTNSRTSTLHWNTDCQICTDLTASLGVRIILIKS